MKVPLPTPSFSLAAADGHHIDVHAWRPASAPRAVVQIAHGMGEHAARYAPVAQALVAAGHAVYANDHRGHGAAAHAAGRLGQFGEPGFAALSADMAVLARELRARNAGLPLVLLGHSMGSFAAQQFAIEHGDLIDGLVLSGSAALDQRIAAAWKDPNARNFNAAFEPARTPFDWLSRDAAQVDAYIADPLCGFTLDTDSMRSMGAAAALLADPAALKRIPSRLPVWLFTGDHDPVNGMLKWFPALAERYRAAGLMDVTETVYAGARHEVLNETNREQAMADLLGWIDRRFPAT
jgi:alpha-beta hydrolase superfamily lysophospholipase